MYKLKWKKPTPVGGGKVEIDVPVGTVVSDKSSLRFTGKGSANYGTVQQENLMRLLENFADNIEPLHPTVGQEWYDTDSKSLKVCTSTLPSVVWESIGGLQVSATAPTPASLGDFWFQSANSLSGILYIFTGVGRYPDTATTIGGWSQVWPTIEITAGREEYDEVLSNISKLIGGVSVGGNEIIGKLVTNLTNLQALDQDLVSRFNASPSLDTNILAPVGAPTTELLIDTNSNDWDTLLAAAKLAVNRLELPNLAANISPISFVSDGRQVPQSLISLSTSDVRYPSLERRSNRRFGAVTLINVYAETVNTLAVAAANRYSIKGIDSMPTGAITTTTHYTTSTTHSGSGSSNISVIFRFATLAEMKRFLYSGGAIQIKLTHALPQTTNAADTNLKSLIDQRGLVRLTADKTRVFSNNLPTQLTLQPAALGIEGAVTNVPRIIQTVNGASYTVRAIESTINNQFSVSINFSSTGSLTGTTTAEFSVIRDTTTYSSPAIAVFPPPLSFVAGDASGFVNIVPASPPVAAFIASPLTGPAPLLVTFSDQSPNAPTSWAWDFENNGTTDSTIQNPTRIYSTPGSYSVRLTVTNQDGTNTGTQADYIVVAAAAAAAVFGVCTITVSGGGTYNSTPTVIFTGGGGSGATATANMVAGGFTGGQIVFAQYVDQNTFVSFGYPGFDLGVIPTATISGGGGSGATVGTIVMGPGYVNRSSHAPEVSANPATYSGPFGGDGSGGTVFSIPTYGAQGFAVTGPPYGPAGGDGYTVAPAVVFTRTHTASSGTIYYTDPVATANISGGQITGLTFSNVGSWKIPIDVESNMLGSGYLITFVGGTFTIPASSKNTPVEYTTWWANPSWNRGSGYLNSEPYITLNNVVSGSPTVFGRITKRPSSIPITNGGSGYTSNGFVVFSPDNGIGTGVAASTNYTVTNTVGSITINNKGTGYSSPPTISFNGGDMISPAMAVANICLLTPAPTITVNASSSPIGVNQTFNVGTYTGVVTTRVLNSGPGTIANYTFSAGVISYLGTIAAGNYGSTISITVSNEGGSATSSALFTAPVLVVGAPTITLNATSSPAGPDSSFAIGTYTGTITTATLVSGPGSISQNYIFASGIISFSGILLLANNGESISITVSNSGGTATATAQLAVTSLAFALVGTNHTFNSNAAIATFTPPRKTILATSTVGSAIATATVTSGALPPGTSIQANQGSNGDVVIAGTPTTPGTYNFTLQVTDFGYSSNSPATSPTITITVV